MIPDQFLEYPLDWPPGTPKTPIDFAHEGIGTEYASIIELKRAFRALGVKRYTISTNDRFFGRNLVRLKPPPEIPFCDSHGCAVYFTRRMWSEDGFEEKEYCLCSDVFLDVADNVVEVAKAIWCFAGLKDSVSGQVFEQSMRSLGLDDADEPEEMHDEEIADEPTPEADDCPEEPKEELPHVPSRHSRWYRILGFRIYPESLAQAESRYRQLIKQCHPDVGGTEEDASALFSAIKQARKIFENVDMNI